MFARDVGDAQSVAVVSDTVAAVRRGPSPAYVDMELVYEAFGVLQRDVPASLSALSGGNVVEAFSLFDPLATTFVASLCFAAFCWISSLPSRDYSWTDRLWSVTPAVYGLLFAYANPTCSARLGAADGDAAACHDNVRARALMMLPLVWGIRLTYNFWRKGGYTTGGEDYRWAWLQEHWITTSVAWQLFNIVFIALYQHILLWLLVVPAWLITRRIHETAPDASLTPSESIAFTAFLALVVLETAADQQQWVFQQSKRDLQPRRRELEEDYERGFLTRGLFRWSRHPNFFAEQSMWWVYWAFAALSQGVGRNAASASSFELLLQAAPFAVGPFLLSLLFAGSTWLTELISAEKYPQYAVYQELVSRLIPLPPSADAMPRAVYANARPKPKQSCTTW